MPEAVVTQPTPGNPNSVAQVPPAPNEVSDSENEREEDSASAPSEAQPEEVEESEDTVSLNVQSKQDFKRVFRTLNVNFGNYFETQRINRPYCNTPKGNIPLLVLDGGEDPSWFDPKGGYFKTSDLPPKKSAVLPPDSTPNVATQRPPYFTFKNPQVKELLEAKPLEKAVLDSLAFTDSTPVGIKSSPHVNLDTLLRSGMYDFLIVDKLFQIMFDLLGMAQTDSVSGDTGGSLELLKEVMSLAAQTSLKASHCVTAAFVANRVALRESVLDKFASHEDSREVLRGSSFASKDLFGPIPDSLKDKLSASNGEWFMFTTKASKPSGTSQTPKRRTTSSTSAAKRRKVAAHIAYDLQRPQSMPTPSTSSGSNFRRQGKPMGRGFQKKRGGYN